MDNVDTIGNRLYTYRVNRRIRQMKMARELGISQTYYSLIENNKIIPSESVITKLYKYLESEGESICK